ncbi:MAG: zinc metallopeptidase [Myxococcales bacterium]|nr:zinc metallopeptidase [Myxococcales bacterium]
MKYDRGHESQFVEDRRGAPSGGKGGKGKLAGLGIVGVIVAFLASRYLGVDISQFLGGGGGAASGPAAPISPENDPDRELKAFVSFVLDDAQATWTKILPPTGTAYRMATMVLFTDAVQTKCGHADSGVGPFYCGGDEKVYIDLSFYRVLDQKLGAAGDFAQAYVIAHEVGHHVQRLQGTFAKAEAQADGDDARLRDLSIRQELQADCFAGVWAFHTAKKDLLDAGDIEEGLGAAAAVGDDTLQKRATGSVQPETWTHGSSAQRMKWFRVGFDKGEVAACDTLAAGAV